MSEREIKEKLDSLAMEILPIPKTALQMLNEKSMPLPTGLSELDVALKVTQTFFYYNVLKIVLEYLHINYM
jgi:hypothetical protein